MTFRHRHRVVSPRTASTAEGAVPDLRPRRCGALWKSFPPSARPLETACGSPPVDRLLREFRKGPPEDQRAFMRDEERIDPRGRHGFECEQDFRQRPARRALHHRALDHSCNEIVRPARGWFVGSTPARRTRLRAPCVGRRSLPTGPARRGEPFCSDDRDDRAPFCVGGGGRDRAHAPFEARAPLLRPLAVALEFVLHDLDLRPIRGGQSTHPFEPLESACHSGIAARIRRRRRNRACDVHDHRGGQWPELRQPREKRFTNEDSDRMLEVLVGCIDARRAGLAPDAFMSAAHLLPDRRADPRQLRDEKFHQLVPGARKLHTDDRGERLAVMPRRRPDRSERLVAQMPEQPLVARGRGEPALATERPVE